MEAPVLLNHLLAGCPVIRIWTGLENFSKEDFAKITTIDRELWKQELFSHEEFFDKLYDKLPKEFYFIRELLLSSLWRSPEHWKLAPEHI